MSISNEHFKNNPSSNSNWDSIKNLKQVTQNLISNKKLASLVQNTAISSLNNNDSTINKPFNIPMANKEL